MQKCVSHSEEHTYRLCLDSTKPSPYSLEDALPLKVTMLFIAVTGWWKDIMEQDWQVGGRGGYWKNLPRMHTNQENNCFLYYLQIFF